MLPDLIPCAVFRAPTQTHTETAMEWMRFEFTVVKCVLHEKSLLVDVTSNFVSSSNSFPYYCARVGKMRFERARTHAPWEICYSFTSSQHCNHKREPIIAWHQSCIFQSPSQYSECAYRVRQKKLETI